MIDVMMCMLSCVTPWTVACQTPLSVGFSRQEYWSGLPFPTPGIFPTQGSNPCLLHWQVGSLPLSHQGSLTAMQMCVNANIRRVSHTKSL